MTAEEESQQQQPAAEEARPPAAEAQRTVEELDQHGDKLEEQIKSVRTDWEQKEGDQSVPGAVSEANAYPLEQGEDEDDDG